MLVTHYRPACALIDLAALQHNLAQVRRCAPHSKVLAMVKANGYGHGIARVAEQLSSVDGFGVASIDEAIFLRQKGFLHRIVLIEGLFSEAELPLAIQHRLDWVVHSWHQIEWLLSARLTQTVNIWLKVDTGMHRLGFLPQQVPDVLPLLEGLGPKINLHLMSHFASADESEVTTLAQVAQFEHLFSETKAAKSLANSAAIQRYPQTHLNWVRPGIMLYGVGRPSEGVDLQPVMTLQSQITALKWIDVGERVGYGGRWQAARKSLIGVVAIGYGDGYPRHAPDGTPVWIHGQKAPLVGRVSMDMITLDLTDLAEQVKIDDPVELWGKHLSVDEVAARVGTIGYELLCGVAPRVAQIEVR